MFRRGDEQLEGHSAREAIESVKARPDAVMVNRTQGSGTRILIDRLLAGTQPPGYAVQARNHNAVAAAVAQGRAGFGRGDRMGWPRGLAFLPLEEERYDFVVPDDRWDRPAVTAFRRLLADTAVRGVGPIGLRLEP